MSAGRFLRAGVLRRCASDESGSTAIEYALLASLIAMAIIGGLSATGNSIGGMMDGVFAQISAALAG